MFKMAINSSKEVYLEGELQIQVFTFIIQFSFQTKNHWVLSTLYM